MCWTCDVLNFISQPPLGWPSLSTKRLILANNSMQILETAKPINIRPRVKLQLPITEPHPSRAFEHKAVKTFKALKPKPHTWYQSHPPAIASCFRTQQSTRRHSNRIYSVSSTKNQCTFLSTPSYKFVARLPSILHSPLHRSNLLSFLPWCLVFIYDCTTRLIC